MSVMYVLIAFSLIVALIFLGTFIWAVRSGQYEDKYTPSVRMLFDDEHPVDDETKDTDIETSNTENHEHRST